MNPHSESKAATPPTLRDRLKGATREAILAAAEAIFSEQGLHTARMEDIAARAGVSVGTLYNYFADRETLLGALIETRRGAYLQKLDAVISEGARQPFRAQLHAVFVSILGHFDDHAAFFDILLQGESERDARTFPVMSAKPRAAMREVYLRVEKVMKRGVRDGALRADDAALFPVVAMGMCRSLFVRQLFEEKRQPVVGHAQALVRLFLEGARR